MEFIVYCMGFTALLMVLQMLDRSSSGQRRAATVGGANPPAAEADPQSPAPPALAVEAAAHLDRAA